MMCAFMTPVIKRDMELFHASRSRNNSESGSQKSFGNHRSVGSNMRRRPIGETKRSMSYGAAPRRQDSDPGARKPPTRAYHSTANSRNASKTSLPSDSPDLRLTTDECDGSINNRTTTSPLTKFHHKVMDRLRNVLHLKNGDGKGKGSEDEENDDSNSEVRSNP